MANLPAEIPQQWLASIGQQFNSSLAPALERIGKIESNVQVLRDDVNNLSQRVDNIERGKNSAAGSESFRPSYVEIKGFCKFKDRETEGVPRAQGITLVQRLKDSLPEDSRSHLGDPIMRATNRNSSIKIPIADHNCIDMLKQVWKEEFTKDENKWMLAGDANQQRTLYVTAEPDPPTKKRNHSMGRVTSWAESKLVDGLEMEFTVRAFWSPDSAIFLEPELGGEPIQLAEIREDATVSWHMPGLHKLNVQTTQAANHAVVFFSRNRR